MFTLLKTALGAQIMLLLAVLRVEDTDQARSTRESEDAMVRDLKWLGIDWDEGNDHKHPSSADKHYDMALKNHNCAHKQSW
jgi:glutamyl/glutaminyl-tRNA synthetase